MDNSLPTQLTLFKVITSNSDVAEQGLVENNYESTREQKEAQIAAMSEEVPRLYSEGKVEEAEAALERIRALNEELNSNEQITAIM